MNEPLRSLTAIAAPLDRDNVDTDLIWPARPGVSLRRGEQASNAFARLRFDEEGAERPDFILNRPPWGEAKILVSGPNFGCGSSRELAVWALHEWGIRCVIAPSFGDIFEANACLNGLLPVRLPEAEVRTLMEIVSDPARALLTVDLETKRVSGDGFEAAFAIDDYRRECLLSGLDAIAATTRREAEIAAFAARYDAAFPWARPHPLRDSSNVPG